MADDVTLPNIGAVVHTDEIGGRHYQVVKLSHGDNGIDDGYVSHNNPIPAIVKNAIVGEEHDWIGLTYNSSGKLQLAEYKFGGPSGTVVASLAFAYSGSKLVSVTKT